MAKKYKRTGCLTLRYIHLSSFELSLFCAEFLASSHVAAIDFSPVCVLLSLLIEHLLFYFFILASTLVVSIKVIPLHNVVFVKSIHSQQLQTWGQQRMFRLKVFIVFIQIFKTQTKFKHVYAICVHPCSPPFWINLTRVTLTGHMFTLLHGRKLEDSSTFTSHIKKVFQNDKTKGSHTKKRTSKHATDRVTYSFHLLPLRPNCFFCVPS